MESESKIVAAVALLSCLGFFCVCQSVARGRPAERDVPGVGWREH